jgi:hypothetical protein
MTNREYQELKEQRAMRKAYIEEYYQNARKERIKRENTPLNGAENYYNSSFSSNFVVGENYGSYNCSKC